MPLPFPPTGLYAITPAPDGDFDRWLERIEAALQGGAHVLQLRDKQACLTPAQAAAVAALCREYAIPLIVNDDVELALRIRADGVHLGRHDAPLEHARERLGKGTIVGVSCYAALERARRAEAAGATYVAFGAFFPSASKPEAVPAPLALLARARSRLRLPIVAIGGVTPDNARQLLEAGADLVAVIGALFSAADPRAAARAFNRLWSTA